MYHMRQDLTHVEVQIGANFSLNDSYVLTRRLMQVQGDYAVGGTFFVISSLCPVASKLRHDRNQILKVRSAYYHTTIFSEVVNEVTLTFWQIDLLVHSNL